MLTPDSAADAAALEALSAACSDWERALSQISMEDALVAGCFAGDRLVSVASLLYYFEGWPVADIGVLTHPDWRGQASPPTCCHAGAAFQQPREIVQYRNAEEDIGSQRTAIKAGFIRWYVEEGIAVNPAV
ncbi:MAG: hypothetical protein IPK19_22125 [Chloroflexi bacterium]|nr:hypothetical protein [Chloroflexota bacterium]